MVGLQGDGDVDIGVLAGAGRGDGRHDRGQVCLGAVGGEGGVQVREKFIADWC